jgi:hypothetical protein
VTGVTVQNNLLSGNDGYGFSSSDSDTIVVQNNIIGLNSSGLSSLPNSQGISVSGSGVATGFDLTHNIVSGNSGEGINISGTGGQTITGNFVGLGVNGSTVANDGQGILMAGVSNVTIGGTTATARNVISANNGNGIHIYSDCNFGNSTRVGIYGNYVGANDEGANQAGYGNQGSGIVLNEYNGSCGTVLKNIIGGDDTGEPNIVTGNAEDGIRVFQSSGGDVFGNAILPNVVYGNGNLGINLAFDSLDNGSADTDLGPNPINAFLMSYPATNANYYINHSTINSAAISGDQVTVNYSFQANGVEDNYPELTPSDLIGYRLDFYVNPAGQDGAYAGQSQGKTHLGSFIVDGSTTDASHVFTSPVSLSGNEVITATTTVLWRILEPLGDCPDRVGDGPPYDLDFSSCPT